MTRIIEYKIPLAPRKNQREVTFETRCGIPVRLYVGNYQLRFAMQLEGKDSEPSKLVHIESGMIVGSLRDAGLRLMVSRGSHANTSPRACATALIEQLVAAAGAAKILATIKAAPKINP